MFASRITRCPIPYQPELGAEVANLFIDFPKPLNDLIAGAAGCSPYLAGLLTREADWIKRLDISGAEVLRDGVWSDLAALGRADLPTGLRQAKRRIALLCALADLGGVWPLHEVTQTLTDLADRAVQRGLIHLTGEEVARGKLPGLGPENVKDAGGMAILAMGKMGAGELNYSSDIDLICLFDETRFDPDQYHDARAAFVRITRRLMALLSDITAEGYVFRTDLRLRPDASVTPVCIAMEAAERYYESVGRTWERAAFIKARVCAGDHAAGNAFLDRLAPFVWRKHLDFAAIQDAHDMRLRIKDHKGLHDAQTLEGRNIKLGAGGIREIEFFTQTRQLIAGGRDPSLRTRGTVAGLGLLAQAGWVEDTAAGALGTAYGYLREIEHRLQMIGDAQTHDLPGSADGFDRLARFMGQSDTDVFRQDMTECLARVATLTESFFTPSDTPAHDTSAYLERWRSFPALRSDRAVEIFKRLFPAILKRLNAAANPEEALTTFEQFLRGLPAGVQVFSLFEANPELSQLIVDICTVSPALANYLARNAGVLDAVIGGAFFSGWPGVSGLTSDLTDTLSRASDYEAKLDTARRWQKEWHFRIGVHHLRALITPEEAGQQYSDLAQAVIAALYPVVVTQFADKHGLPPGRGAMVLAMGSLGAGRLTARSDLDLIVIYDAQGQDASTGPRPLAARTYFAKLTQALVTALSAQTAEGKLYDVDMRLRPSGQAGPVATSLAAYASYQRDEAWVWEHLALTRARAVAGPPDLCARVEDVRSDVLAMARDQAEIAQGTQDMRARLHDARPEGVVWQVKDGAGGQQDIELMVQCAALIAGCTGRDVSDQVRAAVKLGWIGQDCGDQLIVAYHLFWRVQQAGRLISDKPLDPQVLGAGGTALLLRDCDARDIATLAARLQKCRKLAAKTIKTALAHPLQNATSPPKDL